MPSRMLVLLTAAIVAPARRRPRRAPRGCSRRSSCQLRVGVEDLRAGDARQRRRATTRAGRSPTWPPSASNRTARQLPVPEVDGEQVGITRRSGRRRAERRPVGDVDAAARPRRSARSRRRPSRRRGASVSWVAPPMCGVMTTFGNARSGCGPAAGDGLDDVERRAGQAAATRARRRAPPRRRASRARC